MISDMPLETCFKPSINFGIIHSITRLHLVGISTDLNFLGSSLCPETSFSTACPL